MPELGLQRSVTTAISNTVQFGLISLIKLLHKVYYDENNKGILQHKKAFFIVYVQSDFLKPIIYCYNTTE